MDLDARLARMERKIDTLQLDVRSLMESRAYARGMWKGTVLVATVVSSLVTMVMAWWARIH